MSHDSTLDFHPNSARKRWWVALKLIGIVLILLLGLGFLPKRGRDRGQTERVSNARQIGLALYAFEQNYGSFPDASTAKIIEEKFGSSFRLGTTTSNDFLRQLLATKIIETEMAFYAKCRGIRRPDGVITGPKALESGECGYSYVLGAIPSDKKRPILVNPLIPGSSRFDRNYLDEGKAVILYSDNSAGTLPVDKAGDVIINGKKLFDPTNPIWEGRPPIIVWPE